jgi:alpha-L-rhamnosidase
MYRALAGVSALEPGYKRISLVPEPGNGITSAALSYETRYGTVRSAWKQTGNGLTLDVTVPGNTTAELRIPAPSRWAVTEGDRSAEDSAGVRFLRMDDSAAFFELGSGTYSFAVDPALGELGEAVAGTTSLRSLVDELADAGQLSKPVQNHLDAQTRKLEREVATAWQSHLSGDQARTASDVHRALSTEANLRR